MSLKSILFGCISRHHHQDDDANTMPVSQRNRTASNPKRIKSDDSLTALPDDVLLIIFKMLTLNEVQCMPLVHSRFNPIAVKTFNQRIVRLGFPSIEVNESERLSWIIARHNISSQTTYSPFAKVLTIDFNSQSLQNQLLAFKNTPLAERVVLKNLNQHSVRINEAHVINGKLKELTRLEHLSFDNSFVGGPDVAKIISGIKLKSFSWQPVQNRPIVFSSSASEVIHALALSSPDLEKLELRGFFNFEAITNQEYSVETLSRMCPKITKLHLLGDFTFALQTKDVISKLFKKDLTELSFSSENLTKANVQWITLKCRKLQKLTLDFMHKPIINEDEVLEAIFNNLKDLKELKIINVEGRARLTDKASVLSDSHANITEVRIEGS